MQNKILLSVKETCKTYPYFKEIYLRKLIKEDRQNIRKSVIRIGTRILIDKDAFEEWIEEQRFCK